MMAILQGAPDLLAARPIYRPDLNLTKENMSSQCIFVKPKPNAPGWHTPAAIEQSHQWHRDLTQSEDQVEMQLKPAFQWANEQRVEGAVCGVGNGQEPVFFVPALHCTVSLSCRSFANVVDCCYVFEVFFCGAGILPLQCAQAAACT